MAFGMVVQEGPGNDVLNGSSDPTTVRGKSWREMERYNVTYSKNVALAVHEWLNQSGCGLGS